MNHISVLSSNMQLVATIIAQYKYRTFPSSQKVVLNSADLESQGYLLSPQCTKHIVCFAYF